MSAITKIYRWTFPEDMYERFKFDWKRITRNEALGFGLTSAHLFQMSNGDFVSITTWPDSSSYTRWVNWIQYSPEGRLYFPYEQEKGGPIISVP